MVVGPTGGGKSVVINTLAQSQTRYIHTHTHTHTHAHTCKHYPHALLFFY